MGIPGCPDLAASTASIASARIELASSPSDTGAIIGRRKLYSAHERASLQPAGRFRTSRRLRVAGRRPLVCVPRHRPAGRARTARSAPFGRSAGAPAALLGQTAVAKKPQLAGVGRRQDTISRAPAGRDCWAASSRPARRRPRRAVLEGLRTLFSVLEDGQFALAGRALQLIDWDRTHQFCGRCGTLQRQNARSACACARRASCRPTGVARR
jgi:hypothetical protein